jgi:HK97 family phage portal protein
VLTPIEFSQVTVGSFTFTQKTFNTRNSIFITLDDDNIAKYLYSLLQRYDKLISNAAKKFIQHGGRKGIAKLPSVTQGDDKQKEQIDNFFNKTLRNYFKAENAVATVPKGVEYTEQPANGEKRSTSEAVDIKTLTCEAFSQAARAFSIPPSLVLGEVADASKALDLALTSAIEPIVKIIVTAINRGAYTKEQYLGGAYLKIDIRCIKHIDIFSVATAVDKLISDGVYSVDEVRVLLGDSPIGEAWSKKHFMTKNYSEISGGEKKNE